MAKHCPVIHGPLWPVHVQTMSSLLLPRMTVKQWWTVQAGQTKPLSPLSSDLAAILAKIHENLKNVYKTGRR